jgi:formate-dependent phosphoribosylglycinamide formyltransferase (GAR transformylase)
VATGVGTGGGRGSRNQKHAALARLAAHADLALHQVHQLARQRQPDAGAHDVAAFGTQSLERLEQARLRLGRQARALVLHLDAQALRIALPAAASRGHPAGCT